MFFRTLDFDSLDLSYSTDITSSVTDDVINVTSSLGWEEAAEGWDSEGWEGGSNLPQDIRRYIPLGARRARWIVPTIRTSQALTSFAMTGISIIGEWTSTRSK
jgi:hypothetical protein